MKKFVEAHPDLVEQMRNAAKMCQRCGKSNATILTFCNGCGMDLEGVPVSYTENVCMGFVYGIEHGHHGPLHLSMRLETPNVLVYDDLLARGSLHLNAIPTYCHLPDWRHLLRNPAKGKKLMEQLDDACWKVVQEQFWGVDMWRTRTLRKDAFASAEDFRAHMFAGLNAVPSQYQVHLQYIGPVITPSDYQQFLCGNRLVRDRWMPLEYVMQTLECLQKSPEAAAKLRNAHTMTMSAIFSAIEEIGGPVYSDVYAEAIRRYNRTYRACANWQREHFDILVRKRHNQLRPELFGAAPESENATSVVEWEIWPLQGDMPRQFSVVQLEKQDKTAIQSYGRPYVSDKPHAASYYSFARSPGKVEDAEAWVASSSSPEL